MSPSADRTSDVRPRILLFFDYACVFCYLDQAGFDRVSEEYDAEVLHVPFELRPEMPAEGFSADAHGLRHSARVESFLVRLSEREGLELCIQDHMPNTHRALVLGEVARDAGGDVHSAVHAAIFDAYFARGEDIGQADVLLGVARAAGLRPDLAVAAWRDGTYDARLRSFAELAANLGVSSTPAALVCNELLIGTRPYRQVAEAVERCLVTASTALGDG